MFIYFPNCCQQPGAFFTFTVISTLPKTSLHYVMTPSVQINGRFSGEWCSSFLGRLPGPHRVRPGRPRATLCPTYSSENTNKLAPEGIEEEWTLCWHAALGWLCPLTSWQVRVRPFEHPATAHLLMSVLWTSA